MAVKNNLIIQSAAVAVVLVLLAGCKEEEKYQLRFSHYLHVTENEMGCDECHGEPGQPSFNVITHATCLDCHDEPEAEEITADTCGMCHQEKQLALYQTASMLTENETSEAETKMTANEELMELMGGAEEEAPGMVAKEEPAQVVEEVPAEVAEEQAVAPARSVFVHTEALAGKCADCHAYLLDEELETVPVLNRSNILAIREAAHGSGQDCLTCHVDMDRAREPASHDVAWMKRHGQLGIQPDASCSVCHAEESCRECHSVMQPANHNNIWRTRSHGVVAAWNRASCQVCHEEDSCTSCHAQNRPRSHNARWSAPGYRPTHCISCHDTSTPGDGCVTCHEGGNDVTLHERYWGGASFDHSLLTGQSCYICHWTHTP